MWPNCYAGADSKSDSAKEPSQGGSPYRSLSEQMQSEVEEGWTLAFREYSPAVEEELKGLAAKYEQVGIYVFEPLPGGGEALQRRVVATVEAFRSVESAEVVHCVGLTELAVPD
eukprot:RCo040590